MATLVTRYVDPTATGDGDGTSWANAYVGLAEWETGEATDLVADDEYHIVLCRTSSGTDDVGAVSISGWNTDATRYIEVRGATSSESGDKDERASTAWDTDKFTLDGDGGNALRIREGFVRVRFLQITGPNRAFYLDPNNGYPNGRVYVDSCFCKREITGGASDGIKVAVSYLSGSKIYIYNTIIVDYDNATVYGILAQDTQSNTELHVENCTIDGCYRGIYRINSTVHVHNTIVTNITNTPDSNTYMGSVTSSGNATDSTDTTFTGATSITPSYVGGSPYDYAIDSDSGAVEVGVSTGLESGITTDMVGTTRPEGALWDAGVFEVLASSSSSSSSESSSSSSSSSSESSSSSSSSSSESSSSSSSSSSESSSSSSSSESSSSSSATPNYDDILFWWTCESTTLDHPGTDYSAGDVTADLQAEAVLSAVTYKQGTKSLSLPTNYDVCEFVWNAGDILDPDEGSVALWVQWASFGGGGKSIWDAYKDGDENIGLSTSGVDDLTFAYEFPGTTRYATTSGAGLTTGVWYYVICRWDTVTNELSVEIYDVDGEEVVSPGTDSTGLTTITPGAAEQLRFRTTDDGHCFIDGIRISNDSTRDWLALRDTENYPTVPSSSSSSSESSSSSSSSSSESSSSSSSSSSESSSSSSSSESSSSSSSSSSESSSSSSSSESSSSSSSSSSESSSSSSDTPSDMVDTGLIVRYYCDEATSGTTPTEILDSAADPFDLTIDYGTSHANFTEVSGNSGLEFIDVAGTAKAEKAINDSSDKVRDAIDGTQTATVELVYRLDEGNSLRGRIFALGTNSGNGTIAVTANDNASNNISIRFNDIQNEEATMAFDTRDVWHIVYDTTLGTDATRVKVYKNGTEVTSSVVAAITQNATASIPASSFITLGNRPSATRQNDGIIFYAALYDIAFTQEQITNNTDILSEDDDTPPASSSSSSSSESSSSSSSSSESSSSSSSSSESSSSSSSSSESSSSSSATAAGDTYYIKNGGDDIDDGLSDATAWETLSAASGLSTGDCVYLKCGDTWTEEQLSVDWDGTDDDNRSVIGAYYMVGEVETVWTGGAGQTRPIIDGNQVFPTGGVPANGIYKGLVHLGGASRNFITVQYIRFEESRSAGVQVTTEGSYLTVQWCEFDWIGERAVHFYNVSNGLMQYNDVSHVGKIHPSNSTASLNCTQSDNITFQFNKVYNNDTNNGAEGIGCYHGNQYITIQDNTIYNCIAAIETSSTRDLTIRRNLCYATSAFRTFEPNNWGIYVSDTGQAAPFAKDTWIYNNLVGGYETGILLSAGGAEETDDMTGMYVYNNIVVDATETGFYSNNVAGYPIGEVKNNIFWMIDSVGVHADTNGANGLVFDYNNWGPNAPSDTDAIGANDINDDANLTKSTGWTTLAEGVLDGTEFVPTALSPGTDKGLDLGSPYNLALDPDNIDYTAFPIEVGTLDQDTKGDWDMGAFTALLSSSSSSSSSSESSSSSSSSSESSSSSSSSSESSSSSSSSSESSSSSSGAATVYYVKNGGNNSYTGLSDAQAWETVAKVNGFSFNTGDQVYFKCDDTWDDVQLAIDWSGASGSQAIVGAYYGDGIIGVGGSPGVKPTFDGSETTPSGIYDGLIKIVALNNYVTVQDFRVLNSGGRAIMADETTTDSGHDPEGPDEGHRAGCDNIQFLRNDTNWSINSGIAAGPTNTILIEGNTCTNAGVEGADTAAISVVGSGYKDCASHNITIQKNKCWDNDSCEHIGVYRYCTNVLIQDNVGWNARSGIEVTNSQDVTIRRNLMYTTGYAGTDFPNAIGIYVADSFGGSMYEGTWTSDTYIYNNILANLRSGIQIDIVAETTDMSGMYIYNNTLVDNGNNIASWNTVSGQPVGEIKNNISLIVDSPGYNDPIRSLGILYHANINSSGWTVSNNNWSSQPIDTNARGTGDINSSPNLFKSADWRSLTGNTLDGEEFVPTATSPGTDQGLDLGSPYNDALDPDNVDYITMPLSIGTLDQDTKGAWDMGAFTALASSSSSSSSSSESSSSSSSSSESSSSSSESSSSSSSSSSESSSSSSSSSSESSSSSSSSSSESSSSSSSSSESSSSSSLSSSSSASPEDFYINFDTGDDTATGLIGFPWKHWPADARATSTCAAHTLMGGNTYYFARDVVYRGTVLIDSISASTGSRLSIKDYGEGDKPIFTSRRRTTAAWTGPVSGVYNFDFGENVDVFWAGSTAYHDHNTGTEDTDEEWAIEIFDNDAGSSTPPEGTWDNSGSVVYYNPSASQPVPGDTGWFAEWSPIGTGNDQNGITTIDCSYIEIHNANTTRSRFHGIKLVGGSYIWIYDSLADWNGTTKNYIANVGGPKESIGNGFATGEGWPAPHHQYIHRSIARFQRDNGLGYERNSGSTTWDEIWFYDCEGSYNGDSGGYVKGPPDAADGVGNFIRCKFIGNGDDDVEGIGVVPDAVHYSTSGVKVTRASLNARNSLFAYNNGPGIEFLVSDQTDKINYVIGNLIYNNNVHDSVVEGVRAGIEIHTGWFQYEDFYIYGNTIANYAGSNQDYGIHVWDNQTPARGTMAPYFIKNNIIFGHLINDMYFELGSVGTISGIDDNCYSDSTNAPSGEQIDLDGTIYGTEGGDQDLDDWNALSGVGTDLMEDPLFTDHANDDYFLQDSSPCIETGTNLGSPYNEAFHPSNTDWVNFPPASGELAIADQDNFGAEWEIGAYVFTASSSSSSSSSESSSSSSSSSSESSSSSSSSSSESSSSSSSSSSESSSSSSSSSVTPSIVIEDVRLVWLASSSSSSSESSSSSSSSSESSSSSSSSSESSSSSSSSSSSESSSSSSSSSSESSSSSSSSSSESSSSSSSSSSESSSSSSSSSESSSSSSSSSSESSSSSSSSSSESSSSSSSSSESSSSSSSSSSESSSSSSSSSSESSSSSSSSSSESSSSSSSSSESSSSSSATPLSSSSSSSSSESSSSSSSSSSESSSSSSSSSSESSSSSSSSSSESSSSSSSSSSESSSSSSSSSSESSSSSSSSSESSSSSSESSSSSSESSSSSSISPIRRQLYLKSEITKTEAIISQITKIETMLSCITKTEALGSRISKIESIIKEIQKLLSLISDVSVLQK